MKYHLHINQEKAIELGLNLNQAHILDLLCSASTWAEPIVINGEVYYWVARQKVCSELPLLDLKPDTAYRHLKKLAELGVIEYIKDGKKDLIKVSEKGKGYYVGNKSEKTRKQIRESSEINPTDPITIDTTTKDKDRAKAKRFAPPSLNEVSSYCRERGNSIDPEQFIDFYSAKNWMIGKNKMKDWKAAIRTWEKRESKSSVGITSNSRGWASNMEDVF